MTEPGQYSRFADFDTATVYEASGLDCAVDSRIAAAWRGARVCGPALTVVGHPGDNLALHDAVAAQAPPGAVIVADVGGHLAGYWGEMLAESALARGFQGLVIDGGVRDITELERIDFPVFSSGLSIKRTGKHHRGRLNVPLVLGGVPVNPGDLVLGDADGLVVLPPESLDSVLLEAHKRRDRERAALPRLRDGETTLAVFSIH